MSNMEDPDASFNSCIKTFGMVKIPIEDVKLL
jgi:hypothetical protein